MKACTNCNVVQPNSGFRFRAACRDKLTSWCIACERLKNERWRSKNKDKTAAYMSEYRKKHRDRLKAQTIEYRRKNPEQTAATAAAYRAANKERYRALFYAWTKANAVHCQVRNAAREAAKLKATPQWANEFFIEEIYDLATRRTKTTGIKWSVDHIVPLRSKLVCGLHVPENMMVIPASINSSKGNRHWPQMP